MCHRLRSTNRPLYGPLKDNEEHRSVALFREKGRGGTSAVLALTLVTEQQLFIHNSFVLSAVDRILFFFFLSLCLCSDADLLCRDVHIYSIHRLTAHMLQAHIHY